VVIDAGEAFSPGQVYVALSRCTSLDGVVLLSRISGQSLANDNRIVQFSNEEHPEDKIKGLLHKARHQYQATLLNDIFDVTPLNKDLANLQKFVSEQVHFFKPELVTSVDGLLNLLAAIQQVARKFSTQRQQLLSDGDYPEQNQPLQARLRSAAAYFSEQLSALLQQMQKLGAVTESRQFAKSIMICTGKFTCR
jgi:hypothetical protein